MLKVYTGTDTSCLISCALPLNISLYGPQVTFNQTISQFYSQIQYSNCSQFDQKVRLQLMSEGFAGSIQQLSNDSLLLLGDFNLTENVTDISTNETGELLYGPQSETLTGRAL